MQNLKVVKILSFHRTLAQEWASDGVRINSVAPGSIFSQTAADNYGIDVFDLVREEIPAKRCGTPEEVNPLLLQEQHKR